MLKIGSWASISRVITENDIVRFAEISGDYNSIHIDQSIGEKSIFHNRVAHGLLIGSMISAVIGMKLPGEGSIYLKQEFNFVKPVFIGDACTARVVVDEVLNHEKEIYRLKTTVINQNNELVVDGWAVVKNTQCN